jgi:hypothetical protein
MKQLSGDLTVKPWRSWRRRGKPGTALTRNFRGTWSWGLGWQKQKTKRVLTAFIEVSAKSTANNRLCYCAKGGKEAQHREPFWLEKQVCGEFYSMGSRITPHVSRKPLLKGVDFLSGLSRR